MNPFFWRVKYVRIEAVSTAFRVFDAVFNELVEGKCVVISLALLLMRSEMVQASPLSGI
jgi:hypothetical protein